MGHGFGILRADACQSAALAGVSALVQHVGAFLTPFLPKLLALLLHPSLANAPAAAALRSNLPVQVLDTRKEI